MLTTKELKPICTTGDNSPAFRPEFVDISLSAVPVKLIRLYNKRKTVRMKAMMINMVLGPV
jgi:hypothetical protein